MSFGFGLWRIVSTSVSGDSVEYGCDDVKLISQLFNGLNVPAVKIKSTNGFYFCDSALRLRNPLDTQTLTIRTPAITAARELAIPVLPANDTMAVVTTAQVLQNKILDATCDITDAIGGGTGNALPATYDTFPSTYDMTTDDTLTPNTLWRLQYRGHRPDDITDIGHVGVRAPGSPTNGYARIFFLYPYAATYTGSSTSASLVTTEHAYYTDFDLTVYVRTIDQRRSTPATWETAWLMFRYNEANGDLYHHYYVALKSNGRIELGKKDNIVLSDEQYYLEDTEPSFSFALGVWNKLRIKCVGNNSVGNHIQIWVDDVLKTDIVDNGSHGAQIDAPNTPAAPSVALNSGLIGMYNEDAEVEFGPMQITDLSSASNAEAYITATSSGLLSNERVLTAGTGITLADGGPGGAMTISAASTTALAKYVTELDILNTTTETDLLNYTVAAGLLATNKAIRVTILVDYLNNTGANRTFTFRIKYGATTMYQSTTPSIGADTTRRPIQITFTLFAKNSAASQGVHGQVIIGGTLSATTGVGDLSGGILLNPTIRGNNAVENSAVAKTLSCTIQHSTASSSLSFRRTYAVIELLG